jgi:hypothetical protein
MITKKELKEKIRTIRTTNELRHRFADVHQQAVDEVIILLADQFNVDPEDIYLEITVDITKAIRRRHIPSTRDDIPKDRQRTERTGDNGQPRTSWKVRHRGAKAWDKYHKPGCFKDLSRHEMYLMLSEISDRQLDILESIFEDGWLEE